MNTNRAGATLSLRILASGYLIYLAWTIARDLLNGTSTLPKVPGWLAAVLFAAVGVSFALYAWRSYRREIQAAEGAEKTDAIPDEEAEDSDSGDDTEQTTQE